MVKLVEVPVCRGKEIIGSDDSKGLLLDAKTPAADLALADHAQLIGVNDLQTVVGQMPVHISHVFRKMNGHPKGITALDRAAGTKRFLPMITVLTHLRCLLFLLLFFVSFLLTQLDQFLAAVYLEAPNMGKLL